MKLCCSVDEIKMDSFKTNNLLKTWKKTKRSGQFKRLRAKEVNRILNQGNVNSSESKKCEFDNSNKQKAESYVDQRKAEMVFEKDLPTQSNSSIQSCDSIPPFLEGISTSSIDSEFVSSHAEIISTGNEHQQAIEAIVNEPAFDKEKFETELVCWAIKHRVNNVQLKGLLQIWNETVPLSKLPVDPRTLLNTPRMIEIFSDPLHNDEKYWYFGLRKSLTNLFKTSNCIPPKIYINISTDGLPISKSSNEAFWPILYNIHEMPNVKPLVVGIYHGKSE